MREKFLKAEMLRSIQANNRLSLRNETIMEISDIKKITLRVRLGDNSLTVLLGTVRTLAVPVLPEIKFIDGVFKDIFARGREKGSYHSSSMLMLTITYLQNKKRKSW